MTQGITGFDFCAQMAQLAEEKKLTFDDDQLALIARLDTLSHGLAAGNRRAENGLYVWGRTGRGKSFIIDSFFASLPVAEKRRVHFHHFFRELHQRLNAPVSPPPSLPEAIARMTDGCRLLCFDEFHLHDPGDAMLVKVLLEQLFQRGILLLTTSNYPPDQLLPNPLYHDRFVPSIALIKQHMAVAALNGEQDYRALPVSASNPFAHGRLLIQPSARRRAEQALPLPAAEPLPLAVGYRTLHVASAPQHLLHFTFAQLCQQPTAVSDYLALCEQHQAWLLDQVPPLHGVGAAAQQRFINLIDVLYEKGCRLTLVSECGLAELIAGVELEDIQRTRSRLMQLPEG